MGNTSSHVLRIGTRGSALALWQANWIAGELREAGHQVEITILKTGGDISDRPLNTMGGIGVFTKEIQRALLEDTVDIAVHSLKDLPTEPTPELALAVVPPRESPHDVLVTSASEILPTIASLPTDARIGTGSIRRQSQLLHARPDLVVADIRGNVDTRLKKLDAGEYDALILAEAGLRRLELTDRIGEKISLDLMVPAVGQGALGIETRVDDARTISALKPLNDSATHFSVLAERSLLAELLAGCLAPVGAHATWQEGQLKMKAVVLSADGQQRLELSDAAECNDHDAAIALGKKMALSLLDQGAAEIISGARNG